VAIEEESRVLVIDFMAGDSIVLGDSVPIDVAVETLADRDIGGLPAVNDARRLIGSSAKPTWMASSPSRRACCA
jgi:CBS domain-containing protein